MTIILRYTLYATLPHHITTITSQTDQKVILDDHADQSNHPPISGKGLGLKCGCVLLTGNSRRRANQRLAADTSMAWCVQQPARQSRCLSDSEQYASRRSHSHSHNDSWSSHGHGRSWPVLSTSDISMQQAINDSDNDNDSSQGSKSRGPT